MSKVIAVDDAGEYGKQMARFLNKPVTPAAIKQAQDCGCDAPVEDAKFGLPGSGLGRSKDEWSDEARKKAAESRKGGSSEPDEDNERAPSDQRGFRERLSRKSHEPDEDNQKAPSESGKRRGVKNGIYTRDESNSEENYGTQYDPKRPLRPGEDEEIPVDEATDKNAAYEAGYAALNAAMEKHKKDPTPENKASLEAAEKNYSASRKSALYKGKEQGKDDKPWVPYDHSKEPEGYEGGGGNKKPEPAK